ncbi:MAG TPA: choice-of-anchor F family protein [Hydrogenophaga sp.]|uniref:choice-of-anchor F family protein n=1 Tax=Hydrogenophaga sp. TaxID=1904254 RepID=UPI002B772151|nr:choice-of-anchor F family protein [Hydrogenophaga sp.]HMN93916.1 choice-of-anchor F family protein [Hydrogenophaga sp.]HMP11963.1 choice-of-anchor F family protein [Hydrogenophaga sp.]
MRRPIPFKPRTLAAAAAVVASMAATAGITVLVQSNLVTNDDGTLTYIYPTTATAGLTPADANGFLIIDAKEDVGAPGVAVYNEVFRSAGVDFDGCIMASKIDPSTGDPVSTPPCSGGVDTGKRFKLRAGKINQPLDLQFSVDTTGQAAPMLYNVYGKLTNETGARAQGFKVEIGTGIGPSFVPSTDTDGLALERVQSSFVGKYPGGLFGGSPAEGLPFFSTVSANFDGILDGDALTTSGVPAEYSALFGEWLAAADVPVAWFYDIDGRPWTDDKLLAWQDPADGRWYTFRKGWGTATFATALAAFAGNGANLVSPPDAVNPIVNPFASIGDLTDYLNNGVTSGPNVYRDQDVIDALLAVLSLSREEVTTGYNLYGLGDRAAWEAAPVTVRYADDMTFGGSNPTRSEAQAWPLVATWHPDEGEEGLYLLADTFVPNLMSSPFSSIAAFDHTLNQWVVTADDMAQVVRDNSSAQTDYFGIPGFSRGAVEDLANVNTSYAVRVDPSVSLGSFTLRVTVQGDDVTPPVTPPSTGGGGGCTMASGQVPMDPTLPLLAALGLAGWGLRRVRRG